MPTFQIQITPDELYRALRLLGILPEDAPAEPVDITVMAISSSSFDEHIGILIQVDPSSEPSQ